jgi:hypothetical protein
MIGLAWRRFRWQAATAAAILAAATAILAVAGVHLARLYRASGIANCRSRDCASLTAHFLHQVNGSLGDHLPLLFGTALVAVPAVVGVLWGAPLLTRGLDRDVPRDLDDDVPARTHWLAARLAVAGLASMAAAGLFSLMVTWSASPIDQANMNRLMPSVFSQRGIVPIGYAALALALGVAAACRQAEPRPCP